MINIAKRALSGDATGDYFKSTWWVHLPGGAFNSRINLNLRENKGYTSMVLAPVCRRCWSRWFCRIKQRLQWRDGESTHWVCKRNQCVPAKGYDWILNLPLCEIQSRKAQALWLWNAVSKFLCEWSNVTNWAKILRLNRTRSLIP